MDEEALYDKTGRAAFRLCGSVFHDFVGKPRGFLVGSTVYDLRGQHRGFYSKGVVRDRMGRVLGFCADADCNGLVLPHADIPPVPYKNLPAPEVPAGLAEVALPAEVPAWSIMRLENMLV